MAAGGNFSIKISAQDNASKVFQDLQKRIASVASPFDRLNAQIQLFGRTTGLPQIVNHFSKLSDITVGLGKALGNIAEPLGVIASLGTAGGISKLTVDFARLNANITNNARLLGISARKLNQYEIATGIAGATKAEADSYLNSVQQKHRDAFFGGDGQGRRLLESLGIGQGDDVLTTANKIGEAIANINIPAETRAALRAMVGEPGSLERYYSNKDEFDKKAHYANPGLNEFQFESMRRLSESFNNLQASVSGFVTVITDGIAPPLTFAFDGLSSIVQNLRIKFESLDSTSATFYGLIIAAAALGTAFTTATKLFRFFTGGGAVKSLSKLLTTPVMNVTAGVVNIGTGTGVGAGSAAGNGAAAGAGARAGFSWSRLFAEAIGTGVAISAADEALKSPELQKLQQRFANGTHDRATWVKSLADAIAQAFQALGLGGGGGGGLGGLGGGDQGQGHGQGSGSGGGVGSPSSATPGSFPRYPEIEARAKAAGVDFSEIERAHGLPPGILSNVEKKESSGGTDLRTSSAGAEGYFQFLRGTSRRFNVNPFDLKSSANGAGTYLELLYKQFGSWDKALAGWNWGEGNLQRDIAVHGDQWKQYLPAETRNFISDYAERLAQGNDTTHRIEVASTFSNAPPGSQHTVTGTRGVNVSPPNIISALPAMMPA